MHSFIKNLDKGIYSSRFFFLSILDEAICFINRTTTDNPTISLFSII